MGYISLFYELVLFVLLGLFIIQSSSFFSSLILVPLSGFIMMASMSNMVQSSFWLYIFMMVFIGGLLILLVSITSTSAQEQTFWSNIYLFPVVCLVILPFSSSYVKEITHINQMSWVSYSWLMFMVSVLLLISLLVITWNVLLYKSTFRGMCPFSVNALYLFKMEESDCHDN